MSKCDVCGGRAQLRLCVTHELILHDTLRDLPQWLEWLADAAIGNVKLSDNGRRGTRASMLDEYAGPDGADKLAKALEAGKFRRDRLLATGRVNAKASRLHARAANELDTWVRHLCEVRGLDHPVMTPTDCARWLATNTHAIASDEAAKECHDTMVDLVDRIRRTVNRPNPPKFCGPCPTPVPRTDRDLCMTQLYAKPQADTVTCPTCEFAYNVEELEAWTFDQADQYSFTLTELAHTVLPKLNHVMSHRTLQRRIREHEVTASGYKAHVPTYQLGEVRAALAR